MHKGLLGGALAAFLLAGSASVASAQMFEQMLKDQGAVATPAPSSSSSGDKDKGGWFGTSFGSGKPHLSSTDSENLVKVFDKMMSVPGGGQAVVETIDEAANAPNGKAMKSVGDLAVKASSQAAADRKSRVVVVVVESATGNKARGRIEAVFNLKGSGLKRVESGPITGSLAPASEEAPAKPKGKPSKTAG